MHWGAWQAKADHVSEIKRLNGSIAALKSELGKKEQVLADCDRWVGGQVGGIRAAMGTPRPSARCAAPYPYDRAPPVFLKPGGHSVHALPAAPGRKVTRLHAARNAAATRGATPPSSLFFPHLYRYQQFLDSVTPSEYFEEKAAARAARCVVRGGWGGWPGISAGGGNSWHARGRHVWDAHASIVACALRPAPPCLSSGRLPVRGLNSSPHPALFPGERRG